MNNFICAFSSYARELYRADIYKVLAMPMGFVVHFRYKKQYVEQCILDDIKAQIDKEVVIFYTSESIKGNSPYNISIRKAKLIKAEIIEETGLFHAFMQLGDFCEITIDPSNPAEKIPSKKFFSLIDCSIVNNKQSWINKIEIMKSHFPNLSFYNIKTIKTSSGCTKSLINRSDKKSSYYKLIHGNKYLADISIANPSETKCKIKFSSSSDDISANIPNPIEVTAQYDDITIPIYLKSLDVSRESSYISFIPENGETINSEYVLNIEIDKRIGIIKPLGFGIFSAITVLSLWSIKENSASLSQIGNWDWLLDWRLIISIIALVISSSYLFSKFNKK